jgi:type II secretory ATPase GspE/PulE/Tfp pilus assembly ATPase PilB-like protein
MAEKKKLGEMLIEAGLIDNLQLDSALGHQRNWGGRLGSILIELGFIKEEDMAGVIEKQLHFPCIEIMSLNVPKEAIDSIKVEIAKKYTVFPIKLEGSTITLAMMDPTDLRITDELQFITGKRIKPALALESEIKRAIKKYYEGVDIEGKLYRIEKKKAEIKDEPVTMIGRPEERVFVEEEFVIEEGPTKPVPERQVQEEPQKIEPKIEIPKKEEKKELPHKVILEAMASLLIEKGIIKKEELLERIKKQLKD